MSATTLLTLVAAAGVTGWRSCWVPGVVVIWHAWTDTEAFARSIAAAVTVEYDSTDSMNDAVEQFII